MSDGDPNKLDKIEFIEFLANNKRMLERIGDRLDDLLAKQDEFNHWMMGNGDPGAKTSIKLQEEEIKYLKKKLIELKEELEEESKRGEWLKKAIVGSVISGLVLLMVGAIGVMAKDYFSNQGLSKAEIIEIIKESK